MGEVKVRAIGIGQLGRYVKHVHGVSLEKRITFSKIFQGLPICLKFLAPFNEEHSRKRVSLSAY